MVERIDKVGKEEYWKIQSSEETRKDKHRENRESKGDQFQSPHDETDWRLLFEKSNVWKKNLQLPKEEVKEVIFRKISLKNDPSLLRVEVHGKDGEIYKPAYVSISRVNGLKIKNLRPGEPIPFDVLFHDHHFRFTLAEETKEPDIKEQDSLEWVQEQNPEIDDQDTLTGKEDLTYIGKPILNRLGIKDPYTDEIRLEILFIYIVGITILGLVVSGFVLIF